MRGRRGAAGRRRAPPPAGRGRRLPRVAAAVAGTAVAATAVVAVAVYARGDREAAALRANLVTRGGTGEVFRPEAVDGLPDPARRFLHRAIAPGTPLAGSVELEMHGEIVLSPGGDPVPIVAGQVLAPPHGFVWSARTTGGLLRIRGFDSYADGEGRMRWKLWGLIPVMTAVGHDVTRSAAGRLAMEAILVPSTLLPGHGAAWEAVDDRSARFRLTIGDETVETLLDVDPDGRPLRASALRWSERAGPGYEPFVVELDGELAADGYTIPSRITAGWSLGADDEFRFFRATVDRATFR